VAAAIFGSAVIRACIAGVFDSTGESIEVQAETNGNHPGIPTNSQGVMVSKSRRSPGFPSGLMLPPHA
jgi:hypothetical protein